MRPRLLKLPNLGMTAQRPALGCLDGPATLLLAELPVSFRLEVHDEDSVGGELDETARMLMRAAFLAACSS